MADHDRNEIPPEFEVRLTSDSHFSWLRTRLSLERTLMSWVRTATALIGFGFTIVQFFERMNRSESVEAALRPDAPRYLGLALIFAGIVALIIACWQYRVVERYLWERPFTPLAGVHHATMRTPLLAIAIGLTLIGLFAFASVLTRAL
jgi:putative membrane protein